MKENLSFRQKNASVVIMAGGSGTRLWPKSRIKKPKQLYALINNESMIKNTVKRLLQIIPQKNIYIATNTAHAKDIAQELPGLKNNLIIEPYIRNTAPCIGLAAQVLKNKTGTIAFLPSDHYIGKEKEFHATLKKAFEAAQKDYLVLIGIRPTDPDTGLGYIKMGKEIKPNVYQVEKFVEKPDIKTAKKYLTSGRFLWNGGMFIAKTMVILDLFKKHVPKIYQLLAKIDKNLQNLAKFYEQMENISFDYAIAEKAAKIAVVPGDFAWSDIGNWGKLLEVLAKNKDENVVVGCDHYGVDTSGCLIHGTERLVATIGLKDVIIVDTPDAVLICNKDQAQDVKKIVETLKVKEKNHYL